MNSNGKRTRVRMYRVGFGDFFLFSVPSPSGDAHVLIDCGVHAGDIESIDAAVDHLAETTDRHLALVIATHRHADHISGFARCAKKFREFKVDMVWMSAWDNPEDKPAAGFQNTLTALAGQLETAIARRGMSAVGARQASRMALNILGEPLGAVGKSTLRGNAAALAMLRGTPKSDEFRFASDPQRRYYKAGDKPELPPSLVAAGVTARVLGPPLDPSVVVKMDNAARQYLSLTQPLIDEAVSSPVGSDWVVPAGPYFPEAARPFRDTKDLSSGISRSRSDAVLAAAKKADEAVNNQSLVVLFEVGGKSLLFVGDAQWGSWSTFLFGRAVTGKDSVPLLPESTAIMNNLDFYKVGHHGSTNSTPIDAVTALRSGCVAMCSTEEGCYGTIANRSEVPRMPLLQALHKKTRGNLARSDQVKAGKGVRRGGKLASTFSSPREGLYIDYTL